MMSVIERCARALWMQNGSKWRESYTWESDDPIAVQARERAMEQAGIVLDAADYQRAVEALKLIAASRAHDGQHAIDVALARNALEAMGVEPFWRGQ